MTTLAPEVEAVVRALVQARRSHRTISAAQLTLAGADAAYAVQDGVARELGWFGDDAPRYWKAGAASPTATPTAAALPPLGVWPSPAQARDWPFRLRGIEAEIALRLGANVYPERAAGLDAAQAGALVEAMCVAIEIVDSRWTESLDAPAAAKLADLQSHGALVLGGWVEFEARDWVAQGCSVRIGAQPLFQCRGTHPLADPLRVLPAWLRHATRCGKVLPAGTVVTTGTWCGVLQAEAGDFVHVEFPGIGAASVQL
jgi:2-keto-4-pentenoate hydratase